MSGLPVIDPGLAQAKAEAGIGGMAVTMAAVALWLQQISLVASCIAAICGAVVGVHAVYRIWKRRKNPR